MTWADVWDHWDALVWDLQALLGVDVDPAAPLAGVLADRSSVWLDQRVRMILDDPRSRLRALIVTDGR